MVFSFDLFEICLNTHANKVTCAADLSSANGTRTTSQDQPSNQNCASRWHQCCRWLNGDFGKSPFYGQRSGKLLLASPHVSGLPKSTRNGASTI
jgi:hypothetical protein